MAKKRLHLNFFSRADPKRLSLNETGFDDTIIDSLPGVFCLIDESLRLRRWNRNFESVTGYSSQEIARLSPLDFLGDPDDDLIEVKIKEVLSKGQSHLEADLVTKSGERHPYFFTGERVVILGSPYIAVMGHDISARKDLADELAFALRDIESEQRRQRAEKEAIKSLQSLEQAEKIALLGYFERNWQSGTMYLSNGFRRLLEISSDAVLSDSEIKDLVHPDDRTRVTSHIRNRLKRRHQMDIEFRMVQASGKLLYIHGFAETEYDDAGKPLRTRGTCQDITQRKNLQAGLAQADRLASMGLLAAGIAHEINNPLSYMLYSLRHLSRDLPAVAELLTRASSALSQKLGKEGVAVAFGEAGQTFSRTVLDDMIKLADAALAGANKIKEIARGLATFSRAEKDTLTTLDLRKPIEHAVTLSYNELKYRAKLVKDFQDVPLLTANEGRLSQVFLNLLINAAHAIEEGNVENNEIRIRTWHDDSYAFVELSDTGEGIREENLGRLFEPFFTTKEVGIGSGLGLSICLNIVKGYGGDIKVKSEVGRGSTFTVCLPLGVRPADTTAFEVDAFLEPVTPPERGRILVVDDEPYVRAVISRMLRNEHDVVVAASGREGQDILESDQLFDLIICDLMMPAVSGINLFEWLSSAHPELVARMVFVTGGAFTPKTRDFLNKIDNPCLEKPFEADALCRLVSERMAVQ